MSTIRSEQIEQPVNLSGSFSGSFSGSISGTMESASYALTSSYLNGYPLDSASFDERINNVLVDTGSYDIPPITVNVATTTILPRSPLYNNGINGINAFISASISGTLGNIDGVTLIEGDHLLVKNQSNQIQNGVYNVISTGSASSYYILSRSISSDETSELDSQIVIPSFGTTNRGGIFAQTTNNPIIGVDNIVYSLQTNTLISQTSAGTQAIYQIPWYITSTRQLSKGSKNFKYINVTSGTNITTSSLLLTGSFNISGSLNVTNGITGSLLGTSSYTITASYWSGSVNDALSSSYALTASYAINSQTSSYTSTAQTASYWSGSVNDALSSSYALTASYALNNAGGGGGSVTLNAITAATNSSSINNGNFLQEWQWNTLTNDGLRLSSSSTARMSGSCLLNVSTSGNISSNIITYVAKFTNSNASPSGLSHGIYCEGGAAAANNGAAIQTGTSNITYPRSGDINIGGGSGVRILFNNGAGDHSIVANGSTDWRFITGAGRSHFIIKDDFEFTLTPKDLPIVGLWNASTTRNILTLGASKYAYRNAAGYAHFDQSSGTLIISANNDNLTPKQQLTVYGNNNNVGIGTTTPVVSAALEINSTTKGFLPPRMTATQASAIPSPAKSLMIYVTDTNGTFTSAGLWIYTTSWKLIIAE